MRHDRRLTDTAQAVLAAVCVVAGKAFATAGAGRPGDRAAATALS